MSYRLTSATLGLTFVALVNYVAVPLTLTNESVPVTLKGAVVKEKKCVGDAQVNVLHLTIELSFINKGQSAYILSRSAGYASKLSIYRVTAENPSGKQETTIVSEIDSTPRKLTPINHHPDDSFAVLRPGMSLKVQQDIVVLTAADGQSAVPGVLSSGDYLLILDATTWPYSQTAPEEAQKKWSGDGTLISEPVKSEPISFQVRNSTAIECK